jgi:endonuclease/exonuclease/phosphatase family metal-dependent hydrolase
VFTAEVPGTEQELTVVVQHWKSGFYGDDQFRRAVDSERTLQAAELGRASDILIVMGDVNEDVADVSSEAPLLSSLPSNLPSSYALGDDLAARLSAGELVYRPFGSLETLGLTPVDARQADGGDETRPSSGRRLDYVFVSDALRSSGIEASVYNARLDDGTSLPEGVEQPGLNSTSHASDHLPVVVTFGVTSD